LGFGSGTAGPWGWICGLEFGAAVSEGMGSQEN
jgi:hypothetical protein